MSVGSNPNREGQRDLATRMFAKPYFAISWAVFLAGIVLLVGWPIRNIALVCWIYGSDGYFRKGIRVLSDKPSRFSDGTLVPILPDLVTGFGAFFITAGGLTLLAILALRFYERRHGQATPDA
jgi:hypothetical protein